eukprot:210558_1
MGQGQGCCGGHRIQERNLESAAKNAQQTPAKKAFFKRQSTSLTLTAQQNSVFYGNLVISCVGAGKCQSEFSKLCISLYKRAQLYDEEDEKQFEFTDAEKRIIKTHLRTKSEELRQYLILLLEDTLNDDKYEELYDNLNDESYKISDENAVFVLKQFVLMVNNDDFFLLQCLSNVTCTFSSRPLWEEITENTVDNDDLVEETILEKVEEVQNSAFYKKLKAKGIELAENEILAVYIYTVNHEFAYAMQNHIKIPCKWKQTFYYFVRGILKVYDAMVYNAQEDTLPKKLYHPSFGQPNITAPFQMLFPINCSGSKKQVDAIAPPKGTMYRFEHASKALSKGKLIGAPIHWISPHPAEEEWVVLPLRVLDIKHTKDTMGDNCVILEITEYQSFPINLYGVDVYNKLQHLTSVKDTQKKKKKNML